jgi:glycosyltransferase involved in cell wall biosynthesis
MLVKPQERSTETSTSVNIALKFDIVLATVGRRDELGRLLDSLAAQTCPDFRLIVVDQNLDERLVPLLERYRDRVPRLRVRSEPGLSLARNAGLAEVGGDVVAFADDDCWYPDDLLARVRDLLRAHPDWDGVTGRVIDELGRPSAARWSSAAGPVDRRNVWTRGVSISIFLRRRVVERVGGFDETLGIGAGTRWGSGDETDYLLRALEQGFTLQYVPTVLVFHPQVRTDFSPAAVAAGRSYGMGMGRVLRKHGYPWWSAAYHVARAVGGAALALTQGRPAQARFYWAVARGRARGWLAY